MTGPRRLAALAALAVPAVILVASTPALAVERSDGDDPGPRLSGLETLGIYIGIPLLVFLALLLLTYAPAATRGPRYRPGLSWYAQPARFGFPDAHATPAEDAEPLPGTGGASARW